MLQGHKDGEFPKHILFTQRNNHKQAKPAHSCVACYQIQMRIFKCLWMNNKVNTFSVVSLFDPLRKEITLTVRQSKMYAVRAQIVH